MTGLRKPAAFKDMSGMRFTRLVVLSQGPSDSNGNAKWHCQCDCGKQTLTSGFTLRNGEAKSCGCLTTDQLVERITKHGKVKTSEYYSWSGMIQRCTNPKAASFQRYGGRGISVCDRWLQFENFYADMGPKPSQNYTIERINNDGNYNPSNCRWATKQEQNFNTSRNHFVKYKGRKLSVTEAAELAPNGITRGGVFHRLRSGWSIEEALELPVNPNISTQSKKPRKPREPNNGHRMLHGKLVEIVPRAAVMMKLSISFVRALKLAAKQENQSMRFLVESVMTDWLRERGYLGGD
jgi:hypothetical protein